MDNLGKVIHKRLHKHFNAEDGLGALMAMDYEAFREYMVTLPLRFATPVLKSLVNGWTTTERMHEDCRMTCLFGCAAPDTMTHYMRCGRLWRSISSAKGQQYRQRSPMERLCVVDQTANSAAELATAFRIYHDIKLTKSEIVKRLLSNGEIAHLASLTKQVANAAFKFVTSGR